MAFVVILIGTDGSGKSSLANRLAERHSGISRYVYFGLKEFRLPGLKPLVAWLGDASPLSRYLLLPLEYLLRRRLVDRASLAILDRVPGWAYDGRSPMLMSLYAKILPVADLIVLCDGDPAVIAGRKQERDQEASAKDMRKWAKVFANYPARSRLRIDTTQLDIDDSLSTIEDKLSEDQSFMNLTSRSRNLL